MRLGASEVAAVLGLSPWVSPWEVWARKTGRLEPPASTQATDIGLRLQAVVLTWASEQLGPLTTDVEFTIPNTPIVAHPDAITKDGEPVEAKTSGIVGPIVGYWGTGDDEIPDYYLVQCLIQLEATGAAICYVPALLGGRGFVMYQVRENKALQKHLVDEAVAWWNKYIVTDTPPPNDKPRLSVVKRLRRQPNKVVPIKAEVVDKWLEAKNKAKAAQEEVEAIEAELIALLGDAEAGQTEDGRQVTYFEQRRRGYVIPDSVFRVLRVRTVKE